MILVKCLEADREALKKVSINPQQMLEDGTDYLLKLVEKPWGNEMELYIDEHCSVWRLNLASNQTTSMHCHPNKTTMLVMMYGIATVHTLSGTHSVKAGDMVLIEKGAFHRTESHDTSINLYEIETPPNKRDLVRLEDHYGRGQGYDYVA